MEGNFLPGFMDQGKYHRRANLAGGFTNDIFNLEERQRKAEVIIVYEDGSTKMDTVRDDVSMTAEDLNPRRMCSSRKLRRSLSAGQKELGTRTPPLAPGKENADAHFKSPVLLITTAGQKNKSDDHQLTSPKPRNPITGEGLEGESRSKLEDATNKAHEEVLSAKKQRRTCIRVRQPPGGKSSIVF